MFIEALALLVNMGAPFAVAIVGVAAAVAVPIMVRRSARREERIAELNLKRAIQLEQFKKGALTLIEDS